MARKPTGEPVGRPPLQVDWNTFEMLCSLMCTHTEIASYLKMHLETLRNKVEDKYGEDFAAVYKKYSDTGKCSLRRNQFVLSKKNAAMAIWLGKQWLGQKDHDESRSIPPNDKFLSELIDEVKQLKDKIIPIVISETI